MHAYPLIIGRLYLVAYHGRTQTIVACNGAHAIQIALPIFFPEE